MFRFLCVVVFLLISPLSHADVDSDVELLKGAFQDILAMNAEEADYFTNYMASCASAGLSRGEIPQFQCGKERLAYVMRFKRKRPLDALMEIRQRDLELLRANGVVLTDPAVKLRAATDRLLGFDEAIVEAVAARSARTKKPRA